MKNKGTFLGLVLVLCFQACSGPASSPYEIAGKLQDASDLAAAEFVLSKMIIADQSKKVLGIIPLNDAVFIANSEATVRTGIDLSQISPQDITIDKTSITLVLPPVKVISFDYPPGKFEEVKKYTHLHPFDNSIDVSGIDTILQQAQTQVMASINDLDIEPVTQQKVKNLITAILKEEGFEQVFISFRPGTQMLMPGPN